MSRRGQDFTLGLVVLTFLGLMLGTFLFLTGSDLFEPERRQVEIHFSLDEGLVALGPGAPIRLGGIHHVGEVLGLEVDFAGDDHSPNVPRFVVTAALDTDLKLYEEYRITSTESPLGGGAVLVLADVGRPALGEIDLSQPLRGQRPQSLNATISSLSDWALAPEGFLSKLDHIVDEGAEGSLMNRVLLSLMDVNAITAQLKREMSHEEETTLLAKVASILTHLEGLSTDLRAQTELTPESAVTRVLTVLEQLDGGLRDARAIVTDVRPDVLATAEHVANVARTVDTEIATPLAAEFDREDAGALLAKIHARVDEIGVALADISETTSTTRKIVTLSRPAIDRVVANLDEASRSAKNLINDILLNPWRLIQPSAIERQRMEVFQAAQMFAEAASRLDRVSAQLEAYAESGAIGPEADAESVAEVEALRASLAEAFTRFREAERYLWDRLE